MIFTKEKLEKYILDGDVLCNLLNEYNDDKMFTSHKWLLESLPKRAIYSEIYGDLLNLKETKKILDVGGGFCSLSKILINNHNYHLLDIMAHDDHNLIRNMERDLNKDFWINKDWYEFDLENYDIIIANDIFPNVDQRLELFLKKCIPTTKEIRMSLTYYNIPKFYITKRIDADEIFCQLAYNGEQIKNILNKYSNENFEVLLENSTSIFKNGRQIFIITIKGEIK